MKRGDMVRQTVIHAARVAMLPEKQLTMQEPVAHRARTAGDPRKVQEMGTEMLWVRRSRALRPRMTHTPLVKEVTASRKDPRGISGSLQAVQGREK